MGSTKKQLLHLWLITILVFSPAVFAPLSAQENGGRGATPSKDYLFQPQDLIEIRVYGEPDLSVNQRLDAQGRISMPLLGDVKISGYSARSAEDFLEKQFLEEQYLVNPQVSISVVEYNPRLFYIFGQVQAPGAKSFPNEAEFLDIIQAISMGGDFTDLARKNAVRVTRPREKGEEEILIWDLDGLIQGDRNFEKNRDKFRIFPGDIIFVPERVF